jgi:hypothetical protein
VRGRRKTRLRSAVRQDQSGLARQPCQPVLQLIASLASVDSPYGWPRATAPPLVLSECEGGNGSGPSRSLLILPILHHVHHGATGEVADQLRQPDRVTGRGSRLVAASTPHSFSCRSVGLFLFGYPHQSSCLGWEFTQKPGAVGTRDFHHESRQSVQNDLVISHALVWHMARSIAPSVRLGICPVNVKLTRYRGNG